MVWFKNTVFYCELETQGVDEIVRKKLLNPCPCLPMTSLYALQTEFSTTNLEKNYK